MSSNPSLYQRRRPPNTQELESIPWLRLLQLHERDRAVSALQVTQVFAGEHVCVLGRQVTFWFGLVDGLLKMSSENAQGVSMTFAGLPPGGWFGEGTVIKREPYRYNVQALRKSTVAGLPIETFHWLLDNSLGFNRYIMNQLNERLGRFIGAREIDRMSNPDLRFYLPDQWMLFGIEFFGQHPNRLQHVSIQHFKGRIGRAPHCQVEVFLSLLNAVQLDELLGRLSIHISLGLQVIRLGTQSAFKTHFVQFEPFVGNSHQGINVFEQLILSDEVEVKGGYGSRSLKHLFRQHSLRDGDFFFQPFACSIHPKPIKQNPGRKQGKL